MAVWDDVDRYPKLEDPGVVYRTLGGDFHCRLMVWWPLLYR